MGKREAAGFVSLVFELQAPPAAIAVCLGKAKAVSSVVLLAYPVPRDAPAAAKTAAVLPARLKAARFVSLVFELGVPPAAFAACLGKALVVSMLALLAYLALTDAPAAKTAAVLPARLKAAPVLAGQGLFPELSAVVAAAGLGRHRFSRHWCSRCG
jgi:hypothetical protein